MNERKLNNSIASIDSMKAESDDRMNDSMEGNGTKDFSERRKGWSLKPGLAIEQFSDPDLLSELWTSCLDDAEHCRAWQSEFDDTRFANQVIFFAVARMLWRKAKDQKLGKREKTAKPVKNWIGFFHALIASGPQSVRGQPSDEDGRWAAKVCHRLAGGIPRTRRAGPATDPGFEEELRRRELQRQLALVAAEEHQGGG